MIDTSHWSQCRERLQQVMEVSRPGILTDFDGTLAHFTKDPTLTVMLPANIEVLDRLAEQVALIAMISGRPAGTLRSKYVRSWVMYHGSHGLDYWDDHEQAQKLQPETLIWQEPLQKFIEEFGTPDEGVSVEDKHVTASIHYRQAKDTAQMRLRLLEKLQPLADKYGFTLSEGRWIWEVKP